MPTFQVTARELVYVDRTYELDAETGAQAREFVKASEGAAGDLVDEQMQDSYAFCHVVSVHDENGNDAE